MTNRVNGFVGRIIAHISSETYYVYATLIAFDLLLLAVITLTGQTPPQVLQDVAYLLTAALAGSASQRLASRPPANEPPALVHYLKD